ncbi:sushi domain-containing protein 6 [Hypomesus transpacificus]|uniref:sushi domain-containing protein 6 n=1 Tax=Hypomesus transpacificus TaxID=137520 RepID=UPI001F072B28|nr:sushi domain-containing protein 6 [Hypomesus transpacificus]
MSAQGLSTQSACITLGFSLILMSLPELKAGQQNCSHPLVPEHGGFRCEPSPCRGFPLKTYIRYFCEPGYAIPGRVHKSSCRYGHWLPPAPACKPLKDGRDRAANSLPSVATTAVGVSIFLLTTTACMVVKSRLHPCHSQSRRSSDQVDLLVDGVPVSLPTYEEAVYSSWGVRMPPCGGPTQLLLAQEAHEHAPSPPHYQSDSGLIHPSCRSPEQAPPPYEAVQSRPREGQSDTGVVRGLQVVLSSDKDV